MSINNNTAVTIENAAGRPLSSNPYVVTAEVVFWTGIFALLLLVFHFDFFHMLASITAIVLLRIPFWYVVAHVLVIVAEAMCIGLTNTSTMIAVSAIVMMFAAAVYYNGFAWSTLIIYSSLLVLSITAIGLAIKFLAFVKESNEK